MTHLRKMMLEELQRRHYSEATTQRYIRLIERFAQHFHCSPDRLGPRHIREYQAQLFTVHKLTPGSVTNHLCALRLLYIQTLKRPWSIADTPYPKKRYRLPTITAADRWRSSNDSPQRNSNSVLHLPWPQLHELTRSHTALATLHSVLPTCLSLPSRRLLSIPA